MANEVKSSRGVLHKGSGGPRKGSGRPVKKDKNISISVSLTPYLIELVRNVTSSPSALVRRLLEEYFAKK